MKTILKNILLTGFLLFCINFTSDPIKDYLTNTFKAEPKNDTITNEVYKVTITMYYATPNQCDDSPLITADGSKIDPIRASEQKMVALSRDLLKIFGGTFIYGDLVEIKGTGKKDGIYRVADTMAKRIKGTVDILETSGTPLYKFKNITIKKVVAC